MDINELIIFKTLADEGNVTKAAERLNYVQSNVTGRIKKLETELDTKLFYRHSRGVSLTTEGKLLLSYTEKILNLVEETKKVFQDSHTPRGPLSIGTNETTAATLLPSVLVSYNQKYPEVELSLQSGDTKSLIRDVLNYKLDGAFVVGPTNHPSLLQTPIKEEELILITNNQTTPATFLTNINEQALLTRPFCIYRKRLEQWFYDESRFPNKIIEFSTLEAIIRCVKAGLGYTIITKSLVKPYKTENQLRFHEIPEKYAVVKTVFIRRKDHYINSAFRHFLTMITEK